jgi:hypothetical protein
MAPHPSTPFPYQLLTPDHTLSNDSSPFLITLCLLSADLQRATGLSESAEADAHRLNRVLQLTGFSDPVYAEAYVTVHQYDIVLDVTVINRTSETLQVSAHWPALYQRLRHSILELNLCNCVYHLYAPAPAAILCMQHHSC